MTVAQRIAQIFGWGFLVFAIAGFASSGMDMTADPALAHHMFGVFPVNVAHNLVHLVFGLWGLVAARSVGGARAYFIGSGAVYLLLAALGFITPSGFGFVPIGGNDIALHLFLAIALLASSLLARRPAAPAVVAAGRGADPAADRIDPRR